MIQIDNTIVSSDILNVKFCCDLTICKGACCIHGDSGAPLEPEEADLLIDIFDQLKPYLRKESVESINMQGTSVIDLDGDIVTPLLNGKECVYVYFEDGIAKCAIEKAWLDNKVKFQKPSSCHLYPIRLNKYKDFEAVNYHTWDICKCAINKGVKENVPLFIFLETPLTRKYGKDWYKQLILASDMINKY
jgi:hypothetical protein